MGVEQMRANPEEINIVLAVTSKIGANAPEGTPARLPDCLRTVNDTVSRLSKVPINLIEVDISAATRLGLPEGTDGIPEDANGDPNITEADPLNPEELDALYAKLKEVVDANGGKIIKMPTITIKASAVNAALDLIPDKFEGPDGPKRRASYFEALRESPNAIMRTLFELGFIERPFHAVRETMALPDLPNELEVRTPNAPNFIREHNGQIVRYLNKAELARFADEVVDEAIRDDKMILSSSKDTISKFDAAFHEAIMVAARARGAESRVVRQLFDSFIPLFITSTGRWVKWDKGFLVVSPPNQARSLNGLKEVIDADQKTDYDVDKILNNPRKRTVERVTNGSSYKADIIEDDEALIETYVIDEKVVRTTVARAIHNLNIERQSNPDAKITLILSQDENNPADEKLRKVTMARLAEEGLGKDDIHELSFSKALKAMVTDPNVNLTTLLCANDTGDFESDELAPLHYGIFGQGALGASESLSYGYDDAGNLKYVYSDPSTGTGNSLVDKNELHLMLPAGGLLAYAMQLEDPRYEGSPIYAMGAVVRASVLETLAEFAGADNFTKFTASVVKRIEEKWTQLAVN